MSLASVLVIALLAAPSVTATLLVSNLDNTCMKCICYASTSCDERFDCSPEGFCGPFFISRRYWEKAGSLTVSGRTPSDGGYLECVKNFQCASRVVTKYMSNTAWDCNNDGVTDCDDYARIHYLGEQRCDQAIEHSAFFKKYMTCRPPKTSDDFSLL